MGASLCCMRSSRNATPSTIVITKSPLGARNTNIIYEAREERVDNTTHGTTTTTLQHWLLLESPNNNLNIKGHHPLANRPPTKLQLLLNAAATSPPSHSHVMTSPADFYTPRISFSSDNPSEKLIMVDEINNNEDDVDQGLMFTPTSNTNATRSLKKKVSFRFPQEADIFIFYSPKQDFVDH